MKNLQLIRNTQWWALSEVVPPLWADSTVLVSRFVVYEGIEASGADSSLKCNFDECLKEQAAVAALPFSNTTLKRGLT